MQDDHLQRLDSKMAEVEKTAKVLKETASRHERSLRHLHAQLRTNQHALRKVNAQVTEVTGVRSGVTAIRGGVDNLLLQLPKGMSK